MYTRLVNNGQYEMIDFWRPIFFSFFSSSGRVVAMATAAPPRISAILEKRTHEPVIKRLNFHNRKRRRRRRMSFCPERMNKLRFGEGSSSIIQTKILGWEVRIEKYLSREFYLKCKIFFIFQDITFRFDFSRSNTSEVNRWKNHQKIQNYHFNMKY